MRDFPSFAGDLKEWSILLNEFKRYTEHFHVPDENNLLRSDAAVKGNIFYLFTYIITWYLVEVVEITGYVWYLEVFINPLVSDIPRDISNNA